MPTATTKPVRLAIPTEVQVFAQERGLRAYLPGLVDLLHRIFNDASGLTAEVHDDPDVPALRWIMFEAEGPWTADQLDAATDEWYRRTAELCPPHLLNEFGLLANRVEA